MSVQFGKLNFDGKPVDPKDLDEIRPVLAPYGPDGEGYICKDNFGILYRAFYTTKESRRETQPHVSESGSIIVWDGRLDNRKDLIEKLPAELSPDSTDLEIVAAGYDRCGTDIFRELIGDWSLSAWNIGDRSLVLAKDFSGTRSLFYAVQNNTLTWCTLLDPLVLFGDRSVKLEEEYIAGWLALFPATHLTPYTGIHAVPPSSFVYLAQGRERVTRFWDFDPARRIRHRTDGDYEEHFRFVFSESVRRRLRSDAPVVAELSGGMDSSSIVCMADEIRRRDQLNTLALHTLSYYDDSEPNWKEHLYFSKVEEQRSHAGFHINLAGREIFGPLFRDERYCSSPASSGGSDETSRCLSAFLNGQRARVILSGTGGDEVAGGVPTPNSELADLLTRGHFIQFARQLTQWALHQRRPWFYLLLESLRDFLPREFATVAMHKRPAVWLQTGFVKRNRRALLGYDTRLKLFGPLPSFQENLNSLDGLRRQLGCETPSFSPVFEKRYPFLDRDLLEALFAFPREQILRPGQRRSLLRRAMRNIVPEPILNRRRKGFVVRAPLRAVASEWALLTEMGNNMTAASLGIVDTGRFSEALEQARLGQAVAVIGLLRTIGVEAWLRNVERNRGFERGGPAACKYATGYPGSRGMGRLENIPEKFQSFSD